MTGQAYRSGVSRSAPAGHPAPAGCARRWTATVRSTGPPSTPPSAGAASSGPTVSDSGARTSSMAGGHVAVGAEDGRLPRHGGQQPDGVGVRGPRPARRPTPPPGPGLGHRLDGLAAPDEGAGQDPLGSVARRAAGPARGPGPVPGREGPHPVVAPVGAPSPGVGVADDQQGHDHDAAMAVGRRRMIPPAGRSSGRDSGDVEARLPRGGERCRDRGRAGPASDTAARRTTIDRIGRRSGRDRARRRWSTVRCPGPGAART